MSTLPEHAAFRDAYLDRFGAALVADAACRAGAHLGVTGAGYGPLDPDTKVIGPAVTVEAENDLVAVLAALDTCKAGDVLVIANRDARGGLTGDIIAAEAHRAGLAGIMVDGYVRDVSDIREIGIPVFSRGRIPIGPLKLPASAKGIGRVGGVVQFGQARVRPGDWIVGDDDGLLVLHADDLKAVHDRAEASLERERGLREQMRSGTPLGEILGVQEFVRKRERDPDADFNEHVASRGKAI